MGITLPSFHINKGCTFVCRSATNICVAMNYLVLMMTLTVGLSRSVVSADGFWLDGDADSLSHRTHHTTRNSSFVPNNGTGTSEVVILMATSGGVKAFSLTSSETSLIFNVSTYGVAYDSTTKKVYASTNSNIYRGNIDGSGFETVFSADAYGYLEGLSIDPSTGNLYAVVRQGFLVISCNTSTVPLTCAEVLRTQGQLSFSNLAFDAETGNMYLTHSGNSGYISRVNMDGSNLTILYDGAENPRGIAADPPNFLLYWVDYYSHRLRSCNLNGENVKTIVELPLSSGPYGVVRANNGRLYWGSQGSKVLQSCDVTATDVGCTDLRTHFTDTESIWHLTVAELGG